MLTTMGKNYLFMVFFIFLAAANTKTNLLYIFASFMATLLILSWYLAKKNQQGMAITLDAPEEVYAGNEVAIRYLVGNHDWSSKNAVILEDTVLEHKLSIPIIKEGQTLSISHNTSFPKRGKKVWSVMEYESYYPFGFFVDNCDLNAKHELLVLPKPHEIPSLPLRQQEKMASLGLMEVQTRSARESFSHLREYQPGDNWRNIHWRATAKIGEFVVKDFQESVPSRVVLMMDFLPPKDFHVSEWNDKFEEAITVTASCAWQVATSGFLLLFGQGNEVISYGSGREHAHKILRHLAQADIERDTEQREGCQEVLGKIPMGSSVIIVTPHVHPEIANYCTHLSSEGNQVILISCSPFKEDVKKRVEAYQVSKIANNRIFLEGA